MTGIDKDMYNIDIAARKDQDCRMVIAATGLALCTTVSAHHHIELGQWEFHYFLDGNGAFINNGTPYAIKPGLITFSLPAEVHEFHSAGRENMLLYWIRFSPAAIGHGLDGRLFSLFDPIRGMEIGKGYGLIFEEIRRRFGAADPMVRKSADYRFLGLLCDIVSQTGRHSTATESYVNEALSLMQTNIGKNLTLDDLADRLGIDKSYFVRVFKKAMGVSPMRYLLNLRLEAARMRLREGDEPLRLISMELGFHDEFHFSHQFKLFTGLSPKAWREGKEKLTG